MASVLRGRQKGRGEREIRGERGEMQGKNTRGIKNKKTKEKTFHFKKDIFQMA